jgi:glycine/D-amino acid oxidase-like deaminating enzyme
MCQRGWDVTVIGPRERLGTASHAAVGVSSLKGHILPSQPLFLAKLKGHEQLPHWLANIERDSGQKIPQIKSGVVEPFFDLDGFSYLSERVFHRKFRGCLRARLVGQSELSEAFFSPPFLNTTPRGAFYYPGDLWFDPIATLGALETAILRLKGTFIDDTVCRVSPGELAGIQVHGANAHYSAKEVVVAVGAYTGDILQNSGLPTLHLQLSPGETLYAQTNLDLSFNLRLGKTNYVGYQSELRWGSTSRSADNLETELGAGPAMRGIEALWSEASRIFKPDYLQPNHKSIKWGLRTRTRDRAPVVGPLFWPNHELNKVWVATGFYKNGLQLAGLIAHQVGANLAGAQVTSWEKQIWRLVDPARLA